MRKTSFGGKVILSLFLCYACAAESAWSQDVRQTLDYSLKSRSGVVELSLVEDNRAYRELYAKKAKRRTRRPSESVEPPFTFQASFGMRLSSIRISWNEREIPVPRSLYEDISDPSFSHMDPRRIDRTCGYDVIGNWEGDKVLLSMAGDLYPIFGQRGYVYWLLGKDGRHERFAYRFARESRGYPATLSHFGNGWRMCQASATTGSCLLHFASTLSSRTIQLAVDQEDYDSSVHKAYGFTREFRWGGEF